MIPTEVVLVPAGERFWLGAMVKSREGTLAEAFERQWHLPVIAHWDGPAEVGETDSQGWTMVRRPIVAGVAVEIFPNGGWRLAR